VSVPSVPVALGPRTKTDESFLSARQACTKNGVYGACPAFALLGKSDTRGDYIRTKGRPEESPSRRSISLNGHRLR